MTSLKTYYWWPAAIFQLLLFSPSVFASKEGLAGINANQAVLIVLTMLLIITGLGVIAGFFSWGINGHAGALLKTSAIASIFIGTLLGILLLFT